MVKESNKLKNMEEDGNHIVREYRRRRGTYPRKL